MESYLGFPEEPLSSPALLTIGSFDGVHLGHQALIRNLVASARQERGLAGLLTFDPHPLSVLRPEFATPRLTTIAERRDILAALGLDFMVVIPFTKETAATPAADFVADLVKHLALKALWIGPDFALGRGREGNAARLAELGATWDYDVRIIEPYELDGGLVRSSRIRALLTDSGAVDMAARLLGRPYHISGPVVLGAQRGRTLGFPTANLKIPEGRLVPAHGVYACWAWRYDQAIDGMAPGYPTVVNIGVRPSFDNGAPSIEAFLLDFEGDLYGETLGLSFVERLRGEQRFAGIDALIAQIRADADSAREILTHPMTTGREGGAPAWVELSHTADWAIRVEGASQRELFVTAATAMYALQAVDFEHPVTLARTVQVEGKTVEQLLVAWLNHLLLAQEISGELYSQFEIQELSETGLRATVYGYLGRPQHTAVKAVTYYDLEVTHTPGGWSATLTFDV